MVDISHPLRYRGYVYDQELGLYYLGSRYYDPAVGGFINPDGLASTGQGIIGLNVFGYCGNQPVSRIDKDGDLWGVVVGAIGVQYAADVLENIAVGKVGWHRAMAAAHLI